MEGGEISVLRVVFPHRTKNNTHSLDYAYEDHRMEIVSHDRNYSNVDVHKQAMPSPKTEVERTSKKYADS